MNKNSGNSRTTDNSTSKESQQDPFFSLMKLLLQTPKSKNKRKRQFSPLEEERWEEFQRQYPDTEYTQEEFVEMLRDQCL